MTSAFAAQGISAVAQEYRLIRSAPYLVLNRRVLLLARSRLDEAAATGAGDLDFSAVVATILEHRAHA